jgi:hypothetical protein
MVINVTYVTPASLSQMYVCMYNTKAYILHAYRKHSGTILNECDWLGLISYSGLG